MMSTTPDPNVTAKTGNLGNLWKDLKCLEQAVQCYITAIRIRPSFADGA